MAWDKTKPAEGIPARQVNDDIRANNDTLETAFGLDHDFTTGGTQTGRHAQLTIPTGSDPAGTTDCVTVWNNSGKLRSRNGLGSIVNIALISDLIPAATKCWFYADTAPTGWTLDATPSDELLGVKGGSVYTAGGTTKGAWFASSAFDHLHATNDHALSAAEMPSHTHRVPHGSGSDSAHNNLGVQGCAALFGSYYDTTTSAGSGNGHNHGNTDSTTVNQSAWRPKARVGIICSKNSY